MINFDERIFCAGCGLPYSSDKWCDCVVSDKIWAMISPRSDGGGVLCFNCMTGKLVALGLEKVPIKITSGPWLPAWEDTGTEKQCSLEQFKEVFRIAQETSYSLDETLTVLYNELKINGHIK